MPRTRSTYLSPALILLCLGQLMCILDISIINIAIPSIQKELGLAPASLQWLITAYVLTYGGFLLVGGRLGDLFGRRKMLLSGLVVFTLASVAGGLSQNAALLLVSRAGQGLGGAIITPTVMSFITGLYPEGPNRNRALGLLGAVSGAGFALGLILGGLLTSTVGWRWVFFINVPIGVLVILWALWILPETPRERQSVNGVGAVLATTGIGLFVYALSNGDISGLLSWRTAGIFIASIVCIALFIVSEKRSRNPLLPPGLLTEGSLIRAVIGSSTFGSIVGPSTLILTLYLQNISAVDPLRTGMAFLPQEATVFLAAQMAGRVVGRFGTRHSLATGMAAFAAGAYWLTHLSPEGGYVGVVMPGLLLIGFGIGGVNVAGSIAATEGVSSSRHGVSTGLWNTGTQLGTALGLAVLTSVAGGHTSALQSAAPGLSSAAATVSGYRVAFAVAVGFALVGITGVLLQGRRRSPTAQRLPL